MEQVSFDDFLKVEFRSGTVVKAEPFTRARNPSYKVWVDFGEETGTLQTSAQITQNYQPDDLIGKSVIGCVNLGEKNIAGFLSQFLLVGFADKNGDIVLAGADARVPNGQKLH